MNHLLTELGFFGATASLLSFFGASASSTDAAPPKNGWAVGAAADCESIGLGFLAQPVNALSALAFVLVGLGLLIRKREHWAGLALVATGVGSFLFHGPMPVGSEWAHDFTLVWLLTVLSAKGTSWERVSHLPALILLALVVGIAPGIADPTAVVAAVVAVLSILRRNWSWASVGPLLLAGASGLYGRLGATGGPLCAPESIWQPHGIWHVGAAIAVGWLARASHRGL